MRRGKKIVVMTGPVEWARVFEFNRDMEGYQGNYKDCDGAYTVNQIIDRDQLKELQEAGSKKKPMQKELMENGRIVIKHERKHLVPKKPSAGLAPDVVDSQGNPWDPDERGLIGNGSVCRITSMVDNFEITNEKGEKEMTARTVLQKVEVVKHVKYDNGESVVVEDNTDSVKEPAVADPLAGDDIPF